jgi:hypothetical protein
MHYYIIHKFKTDVERFSNNYNYKSSFNGKSLISIDEYLKVEKSYLNTIKEIVKINNCNQAFDMLEYPGSSAFKIVYRKGNLSELENVIKKGLRDELGFYIKCEKKLKISQTFDFTLLVASEIKLENLYEFYDETIYCYDAELSSYFGERDLLLISLKTPTILVDHLQKALIQEKYQITKYNYSDYVEIMEILDQRIEAYSSDIQESWLKFKEFLLEHTVESEDISKIYSDPDDNIFYSRIPKNIDKSIW